MATQTRRTTTKASQSSKRTRGKANQPRRRTKAKANQVSGVEKTLALVEKLAPAAATVLSSRLGKTAVSRASGKQQTRTRAALAASTAAVGGGVITYRLLRSGGPKK